MQGLGLLILRIVFGLTFLIHGLPRLVPLWGGTPRVTAALLETAGVTPAYPIAVGIGLVEILAGTLLLAGAYTVWASLLLAISTGAFVWTTGGQSHGYALAFILVGGLSGLMFTGPGLLSIDRRRARLAETRKLSRAVMRAGKQ